MDIGSIMLFLSQSNKTSIHLAVTVLYILCRGGSKRLYFRDMNQVRTLSGGIGGGGNKIIEGGLYGKRGSSRGCGGHVGSGFGGTGLGKNTL